MTYSYLFGNTFYPPYLSYPNSLVLDFASGTRISSNAGFSTYRTTNPNADYTLVLSEPGPENLRLPLSYVGFGTMEESAARSGGTGTRIDFRAFSYGLAAEESAVPTTGTGQYAGMVIGRAVGSGGTSVYALTGTLNMTMDFAARTYTGTLTLSGNDERTGTTVQLGTYPITTSNPYPTPLNDIMAYLGTSEDRFRAKLA